MSDEESALNGPHWLNEVKTLTGGKEARDWAVAMGEGNSQPIAFMGVERKLDNDEMDPLKGS